jgi:hypothetical protein
MEKIALVKLAVSAVVGAGTSRIVSGIVKNNTSPEKVTDVVSIVAGTWVLGGIVADVSKKYTDAKIDNAVDWWNENVKPKLQK